MNQGRSAKEGSENITPYLKKFKKLWDYAQEPTEDLL